MSSFSIFLIGHTNSRKEGSKTVSGPADESVAKGGRLKKKTGKQPKENIANKIKEEIHRELNISNRGIKAQNIGEFLSFSFINLVRKCHRL